MPWIVQSFHDSSKDMKFFFFGAQLRSNAIMYANNCDLCFKQCPGFVFAIMIAWFVLSLVLSTLCGVLAAW